MINTFSLMQDYIIDLQKFDLIENRLYVEGVGIITGQSAKEWKDIDYKLIFKNDSGESYVKQLGKANRTALTQKYAVNTNFCYDKCWFATQNYQGVDITDLPAGNYELLLKITINGFEKTFPLCSQKPINFSSNFFDFKSDNEGNKLIKKLEIKLIKSNGQMINIYKVEGIEFKVTGGGNIVTVHEGTFFTNCSMTLLSNMNITIGKSHYDINKLKIFGTESKINIGQDFSCQGMEIRCSETNSDVLIGEDCIFSEEILLYPADGHTLYDNETKEVLNQSEQIIIGDHVWCGRRVSILKGAIVPDDSVIGMGSLITKKFNTPNSIIAGAPAKIIKSNINWDRQDPFSYKTNYK